LALALASLLASIAAPSLQASAATEPLRTEELKFEMWSLPWFPQSDKAAEVIAQQLEQVGIKVELKRLESSIMYPRIENFDFQVYALATSQSPNPLDMVESFHSKFCQPGIGSFWCHADPEVDKMIDAMRSASSLEEAKRIAVEIQEKLARESGFIPIYLTQSVKVIRAEWKNYTLMPGGLIEVYDIWSMLYMYKSDVPEENVFKIAFPSDVLTLNPFMATDLRSLWIINLIYDPLFRLDKDMKVVPWLAESWEVSPDGTVYTIKLRSGVKWHDGKPLTADDVVYTFSEGMRQNTSRYIGLKDVVKSVEKVDDRTVRFVLYKPNPFFILTLTTGFYYIVPKHVIEGVDLKKWTNDNPIGSGPFKFVERVVGERIVLEKNDGFWIKGVPKITKVVMKVIPDAQSRFLAIKTGEVDTERYDTLITLVKQAERDPNLKVVTAPGLWLIYIAFNTYSFFNDPKVFEAIHYAINRTEVIEKANGGYGYPVYTILNKYWHDGFAAQLEFKYDPEKAKKILEEAGWVDVDGDGIREYVGAKPTTPATSPTSPATTPSPTAATSPSPTTTPPATSSPTPTATPSPTPGGVSLAAIAAAVIVIILLVVATVALRRRG
jgi:ABC-type transport system substrate-binding protein